MAFAPLAPSRASRFRGSHGSQHPARAYGSLLALNAEIKAYDVQLDPQIAACAPTVRAAHDIV